MTLEYPPFTHVLFAYEQETRASPKTPHNPPKERTWTAPERQMDVAGPKHRPDFDQIASGLSF